MKLGIQKEYKKILDVLSFNVRTQNKKQVRMICKNTKFVYRKLLSSEHWIYIRDKSKSKETC